MAQGKRFVPTPEERKQVEAMSGYGVPTEQIACLIRDGIDNETLVKHFKRELAQGKAKANSKVGQTLFQKATSGDTSAAIWWSKTQMRWSETKNLNIGGQEDNPLVIRNLTDEELERIITGSN